MTTQCDDRYEGKIPRLMRDNDNDFHLWCFRVKAPLRGKRVLASPTSDRLSAEAADQTPSTIVCALGDSLLRAIQEYCHAEEA